MASPRGGVVVRAALFVGLSVLCGVLAAGVALPAIGLIGVSAQRGAESFSALPGVLQEPVLPQRSRMLAADGTVLARFYDQNRVYVPIAAIAQPMQDAIVAVEDARFYEHNGVDIRGTLRALVVNSQSGGVTQGGSTLTQQYVKNVLALTAQTKAERAAASEQTISRKIRELRLALGLEQRWTKQQILEGYLNIAYFGAGAYGVEAAARRYFSTSADSLTIAQAATLAGIVQNPTAYDPLENPAASQERRSLVLGRMASENMISSAQLDRALAKPVKRLLDPSTASNGCFSSWAPFFCDYALQTFLDDEQFGATRGERRSLLMRGGVTIKTTLDPVAQKAAQKAVDSKVPAEASDGKVAAISMVEPGTGNVVAMAQNRGYGNGRNSTFVNYNVDAAQNGSPVGWSAGSTFKAFTLAAAIEKGLPVDTPIYAPLSKVYPPGAFTDCDGNPLLDTWPVGNSTISSGGTYTMRTGTAMSVNTFFSELELRIGVCSAVDMAKRLGVHQTDGSPVGMNASFTLGTDEVAPLTLANAYATFGARGQYCEPRAITLVRNTEGEVVAAPGRQCKQVMDQPVADAVNSVLAGVLDDESIPYRTGYGMSLSRPAAAKTGTIDTNAAVWFAGYTPDLAAAATVSDPRGPYAYPLRDVVINGQYYPVVYGRDLPGPIWQQAMLGALADTPPSSFVAEDPSAIVGLQVPVPYLAGLSPADALKQLEKVGLLGTVSSTRVNSSQAEGTVAYSSPGAGGSTISGTTVTLYLSNGTPPEPSPSPKPSETKKPKPESPSPSASPGNGGGGGGGGGG